jgi:hypothetical protein
MAQESTYSQSPDRFLSKLAPRRRNKVRIKIVNRFSPQLKTKCVNMAPQLGRYGPEKLRRFTATLSCGFLLFQCTFRNIIQLKAESDIETPKGLGALAHSWHRVSNTVQCSHDFCNRFKA